MCAYLINGGRPLSGSIVSESAKNAVLPMLAASILTEETTVIKNCPKIGDVIAMREILTYLGVSSEFSGNDIIINASKIKYRPILGDLSAKLRSSVFLAGALLSRFNLAEIAYPGGCKIGKRPLDIHVSVLRQSGATVNETEESIFCVKSTESCGIIRLRYPSVGATENAILCSVLSKGETFVTGAAEEPEIRDLANFLNSMGARIYGAGSKIIKIEGVKRLHGTEFTPIPDRIEIGTYLVSAAITGGEVEIKGANTKNLFSLINKFCDNTCKINISNDIIYLKSGSVRKRFNVTTGPYPDFPTDMQPQMLALAAVSKGTSLIKETVFENRFGYAEELVKMGARIRVKDNLAVVRGVNSLIGAEVTAGDLRGGAALVLAGLSANGTTKVNGVSHIERGYYNFIEKLKSLGADVSVTKD